MEREVGKRLGNEHTQRLIFRDDAVRSYVESQEKAVLPRLVSPQTFVYLWSLLGLLAVSSLIAWFVKIPVYASGLAVVTRWHKPEGMSKPVVVAFLPPQYMTKLRANQKLFLKFAGDRYSQRILFVEPQIRSPDFMQKALSPSTEMITQPVAVVTTQWQPPTLPAAVYLGSIGSAEVEIGQQRAISLLPVIGQFARLQ